jgi:hypothetical protein
MAAEPKASDFNKARLMWVHGFAGGEQEEFG